MWVNHRQGQRTFMDVHRLPEGGTGPVAIVFLPPRRACCFEKSLHISLAFALSVGKPVKSGQRCLELSTYIKTKGLSFRSLQVHRGFSRRSPSRSVFEKFPETKYDCETSFGFDKISSIARALRERRIRRYDTDVRAVRRGLPPSAVRLRSRRVPSGSQMWVSERLRQAVSQSVSQSVSQQGNAPSRPLCSVTCYFESDSFELFRT